MHSLRKRIEHRHAAACEVSHIASHNRETMMLRARSNHRILDANSEARHLDMVRYRRPSHCDVEGPGQARNFCFQAHKPFGQRALLGSLCQPVNASPDLRHHNCVHHTFIPICDQSLGHFGNLRGLGRFGKDIDIDQEFHSKQLALRSSVVSSSAIGTYQSLTGQDRRMSTQDSLAFAGSSSRTFSLYSPRATRSMSKVCPSWTQSAFRKTAGISMRPLAAIVAVIKSIYYRMSASSICRLRVRLAAIASADEAARRASSRSEPSKDFPFKTPALVPVR